MDKYLITSFKNEIANAILNMQDKLNPDKDAYISKDELPKVLDFFGVDDVSKLLKSESETEQSSIFENKSEEPDAQGNEDTIEISNPPEDNDDAISTYGTAAFNLQNKINADLSINSSGNLFTEQYSLLDKQLAKQEEGKSISDLAYKKSALYALQEDYQKENSGTEQELLDTKKISYGKNGEKKALMSQSFKLNGNNAFKPDSTQDSEGKSTPNNGDDDDEDEDDKGSNNSDSKNSASATVSYNIDFKTLNGIDKGNWHIIGKINAGSDNSDIQGALQYTKTFNNDSSINFTGNLRETIEDKNNTGSYGASIDYRLKKFSTGGYAVFYHTEVDGIKDKEHYIELHGNYGNSFFATAGLKHYNMDYKYVKGLIQGKRELVDGCLTLKGGIGAEYGFYDNDIDNLDEKELILKAKGQISFKSKDLNADLSAIVTVNNNKTRYMDYEPITTKTTTIGVLGKVETKNFNITTALSSLNVSENRVEEEEIKADTQTTVMAQVVIGLKNFLGKKVMPILKYNVGNYDGASQNLGAGVIITP